MITLAMVIEYDGTDFSGWQIQPNAPTLQESLQNAWKKITGQNISIMGSGRTDAGVHSFGQVASANIEQILIPEEKIAFALNSILPNSIKIVKAKYLDFEFHSRFDAVSREYVYYLGWNLNVFNKRIIAEQNRIIDFNKVSEIAPIFLGKNDFTSLSKNNPDIKNNFCIIEESNWNKIADNIYKYHIKSNHFLYGMVRAIVGVMIDYSAGKISKEKIEYMLQNPKREYNFTFAKPNGLYLNRVNYIPEINGILYA
jgi:tRNA pseudouridine38-40 synthase